MSSSGTTSGYPVHHGRLPGDAHEDPELAASGRGPADPRVSYDALHHGPLTRDEAGRWVVARHADVVAVATDPVTFSSRVSRFLQVPNGLDGAEHRRARALLDPFLSAERVAWLAPVLRDIAAELVAAVPAGESVDAVDWLGARYAVRAQSAWLGWPAELEDELLEWMADNHAATREGDLARTSEVAERFDAIIRRLLDARRSVPADDVTTELVRLRDDDGRPLADDVLVSVLRNWTGGDLGSLALCAGVVLHWVATHPEVQDALRLATAAELDAAIDELLRIDDPFVSNRRLVTADATVGGQVIEEADRVLLNWTAANRDPEVFGDPDAYDPDGNAAANLVWGIGPHACPGRPLATLELRVLLATVLKRCSVRLDDGRPALREQPPLGGFSSVHVLLEARG